MWIYFLSNLNMGGGGTITLDSYPDPFAATSRSAIDPFAAVSRYKGS